MDILPSKTDVLQQSGLFILLCPGQNEKMIQVNELKISKNKVAKTFSVRNPIQINPYYYKQDVLSGIINTAGGQKQPPLFERAILLTDSNKWRLFVSGTASIIGQETVAIGNQCEQTIVTIENIRKLTSKENLMIYFPEINFDDHVRCSRIRVYVKNAGDIPEVKSICINHFGNIPSLYVHADICRKDLLVEIEAEFISRQ